MTNVEGVIKNNAVKLKHSRRDIEIAPDITKEKKGKWIKKYKGKVEDSIGDKLIILSDTRTGSLAITGKGIYFDNFLQGGLKYLDFYEISSVKAVQGGLFEPDKVVLHTSVGKTYHLDGAIDGIDIVLLSGILNKIAGIAKNEGGEFVSSKQNVALYDLSDQLKLVYLEILCNYAYINDNLIDAPEYTAIGNFIVRMELRESERTALRRYMNNISERYKTGTLLKRARDLTVYETGQWDAFRYSLMQDTLLLHEIQNPGISWMKDGFIGSLLNHSGLCPEQIDTMSVAVKLNKKMQQKGCDYTAITKEWKELFERTRYTENYVPSMYLFCSGSVYGVKCYEAFFATGANRQESINKKREVILQEIILNNQRTIDILTDDLTDIASRLEEAINEGEEHKEKYQALINRLKKASDRLKKDRNTMQSEL